MHLKLGVFSACLFLLPIEVELIKILYFEGIQCDDFLFVNCVFSNRCHDELNTFISIVYHFYVCVCVLRTCKICSISKLQLSDTIHKYSHHTVC